MKYYRGISSSNPLIQNIKDTYITEDKIERWSDAEMELGRFTDNLSKGDGKIFSVFHGDMVENLSIYLASEEKTLNYAFETDAILSCFFNMIHIDKHLKPSERESFSHFNNEPKTLNLICYNYTESLLKCAAIVKKQMDFRSFQSVLSTEKICIGDICYVHGMLGKPIVFGVNDESQIANPNIFDCENGELYKNIFIKRNANEAYKENNDSIASGIITESDIICIYGMSIGQTDKIWWERVCDWLMQSDKHILIIFKYGMPNESALPTEYLIAVENVKNDILKYSTFSTQDKKNAANRIFVSGENIFREIKDMKKGTLRKYEYEQ